MKYYNKWVLFILLLFLVHQAYPQAGFQQKGKASYYADKFNGRKTASGEIFSNNKMTAAHRTLAFNTVVRVTNLTNSKSVVVRINDRGPYAHNRIIDLSKVAARKLDMIRTGTAKVKVEVIKEDEPNSDPVETTTTSNPDAQEAFFTGKSYSMWGTQRFPKGYGIQVGSYEDIDNAKDICKSLVKEGIEEIYIQVGWSGRRVYRVLVGAFEDKSQGGNYLNTIREAGFDGFIKKHFD
ncbi:MAG: septal ring lytic transglycosylase RlpA family protein [Thermonemataceae bacterium]